MSGAVTAGAGEAGVQGTRQEADALRGTVLLQSPAEWEARNEALAAGMRRLIAEHLRRRTGRALDVGCMNGELTSRDGTGIPLDWWGVDPDVAEDVVSPGGALLSWQFAFRKRM